MREIKFRAWDGKRMTTSGIMFNNTNSCLEVPQGSQMKLMQYTGLKDKNGKEIYEGDIINSSMRFCAYGTVVFSEKLGAWVSFVKEHNDILLSELIGVEILGNIYENPELL